MLFDAMAAAAHYLNGTNSPTAHYEGFSRLEVKVKTREYFQWGSRARNIINVTTKNEKKNSKGSH